MNAEPDRPTSVLDALERRAATRPDSLAYRVVGEGSLTYGELRKAVRAMAAHLDRLGFGEGMHCAIALPTSLLSIRLVYAVQSLGGIPIMLNPAAPPEALARRLRMIKADLAALGPKARRAIEEHQIEGLRLADQDDFEEAVGDLPTERLREPNPEDIAYFQVTSGTTGEPKAAMISHHALISQILDARDYLAVGEDDVLVSWLPLHHDFGLVRFMFSPLVFGLPVHLIEPSLSNLGLWIDTICAERGTLTASPDFGFRLAVKFVEPGPDLSSLRCALNGGEPVRSTTIDAFEKHFGLSGVVRPGYGLAEATLGVAYALDGEEIRCDDGGNICCGRPVQGVEVRIVDGEGMELPAGEAGEILVRGKALFSGYFESPKLTQRVLCDGWLHTGDLGSLDQDGFLYVIDRLRSMIKTGGSNIAPREVQESLDTLDDVRFSAAVGLAVDDHHDSEALVIVAEVHQTTSTSPEALDRLATAMIKVVRRAIGARPWNILLTPPKCIPRTPNGKIKHGELKEWLRSGRIAQHIVYDRRAKRTGVSGNPETETERHAAGPQDADDLPGP